MPKGTSDYQAAWITNSDDEEEAGDDENDEHDEFEEEMEGSDSDLSMVMIVLTCRSYIEYDSAFLFLAWVNSILSLFGDLVVM